MEYRGYKNSFSTRCRRLLVLAAERLTDDRHERLQGLQRAGDTQADVAWARLVKESVNNLIKRVGRTAFGFRRFAHHRSCAPLYASPPN
jgi:hypothetical protein